MWSYSWVPFLAEFVRKLYKKMENTVSEHGYYKYKNKIICKKGEFYRFALNDLYLAKIFVMWFYGGHQLKETPTVDRKDSSRGYEINNIQFINFMDNTIIGNNKL